ncbi:AAA-ATPase At3g50940-like [Magnolia sinica]|uniref:AAA-ATPase At3g50940-like n=1 Tax=Magnolia sinica TaxID=86752 RepID=UPI002657BD69|nr:AAA-ATPase At3g50940-like [Magnolia sinica]
MPSAKQIISMPSAKTIISTAASLAATAMVVRKFANSVLPRHLQDQLFSSLYTFLNRFSTQLTLVLEEFNGFAANELYAAAEIYLGSKISPSTTRLKVFKHDGDKDLSISMEKGEEIIDVFQGMKLQWQLVCLDNQKNTFRSTDGLSSVVRSETRSFQLTFHKKHKDKVFNSYFPFLLSRSKALNEEKKTLKLHTIENERISRHMGEAWTSVNLKHPATFSTVAMDSEVKQALMDDLEMFVKRKEFYKRVGKAWKRGYLLYGPPGTGKSSLIAAMANFLNFDVYDLELTDVRRNSDLRRLLIGTANQSILVIEDIDCTVDFKDREAPVIVEAGGRPKFRPENQVTLSGLLNFIDGLWSSCGDERIIIFTTNHKDKLDPALLRPGRMDKHIHMSYCSFCGFKTLAKNYLMIDDHPLFGDIQRLIAEVEVTPAQVAEELMMSDSPDVALQGLIEFIQRKKIEDLEAKAKEERESQNGQETKDNGQNMKGGKDEGQNGKETKGGEAKTKRPGNGKQHSSD